MKMLISVQLFVVMMCPVLAMAESVKNEALVEQGYDAAVLTVRSCGSIEVEIQKSLGALHEISTQVRSPEDREFPPLEGCQDELVTKTTTVYLEGDAALMRFDYPESVDVDIELTDPIDGRYTTQSAAAFGTRIGPVIGGVARTATIPRGGVGGGIALSPAQINALRAMNINVNNLTLVGKSGARQITTAQARAIMARSAAASRARAAAPKASAKSTKANKAAANSKAAKSNAAGKNSKSAKSVAKK